MLRHRERLHLLRNGSLDDIFELVFGVAAELAGVAVVGEWHGDEGEDGIDLFVLKICKRGIDIARDALNWTL